MGNFPARQPDHRFGQNSFTVDAPVIDALYSRFAESDVDAGAGFLESTGKRLATSIGMHYITWPSVGWTSTSAQRRKTSSETGEVTMANYEASRRCLYVPRDIHQPPSLS
ncbi:hypothetical protein FB451DRAFT_1170534 [Mycena latifolia]|nr:hypothetical protein FB451DRAFT_1170534 [Mycena latifolia]